MSTAVIRFFAASVAAGTHHYCGDTLLFSTTEQANAASDILDHLADDALEELLEEYGKLKSRIAALEAALPKTADPEPVAIVPGLDVWVVRSNGDAIPCTACMIDGIGSVMDPNVTLKLPSGAWTWAHASEIYRFHPVTKKTPEDSR